MKISRAILPLLLVLCMLLSATFIFAKGIDGRQKTVAKSNATHLSQNTTNRTLVNIGQIAMWIYSDGQSALNPAGNSGLFFPRGNNPATATIFQDGLVWGGTVNDGAEPALRVGGTMYAVGHAAGAVISQGNPENRSDPTVDRIWRVRRDFMTADLTLDAAEFNSIQTSAVTPAQVQQVRDIYRQDWIDWPVAKGAPYYDADGDGQYNPEFNADGTPKLAPHGGAEYDPDVHADEPGIADGDQVVWLVNNDLNEAITSGFAGSPPIGLEQQITLWAYARSDALGQIIFKQFRVIYKGTSLTPPTATVEDMYFCQWSDPDVGSSGDDLAGCDTTLSLGFAYNSGATDATYSSVGLPPPASGYDFFAGPLVEDPDGEAIFGLEKRAGFRNLPMTTFASFSAGSQASDPATIGSYEVTLQWYNLLRGFLPRPSDVVNPSPFVDPNTNQATKFSLSGDPITNSGWVDTGSGDRRILLSSGPFTLAFGDTQETVVATLSALGTDRLSSVSLLKFVDRFAQEAFDNLFELPKPPATPNLTASEFDGQIFLNWASSPTAVNETESLDDKGFLFEGYNVYQLPTAGSTIDQSQRIATFDVVNDFTTIAQESFDISSGLVLELPQQFGTNSGIQRTFTVNNDVIRGLGLVNGQTYYFGVSAYSNNPDPAATVKTLESTMAVVTVVPQTVKPGVRLTTFVGDTLATEHASGVSDGAAVPLVLDPTQTKDAEYEVTFEDITDADGHSETVWNLTNVTSGDVLVSHGTNQSGDANYFVTEGLQVIVSGPPLQLLSFSFEDGDGEFGGARWITGGGHGGEVFFGGAFLGPNFQGSNLPPADFRDIFMQFYGKESYTDLNGNGQYDIGEPYQLRAGTGSIANLYAGFAAGAHLGQATVPFEAYDMSVDPPRQLDIVVRDRDQNGQWDMHIVYDPADANYVDVNGGDLQFNYVYILDTDYNPANWDPSQGGQDYMAVGPLGDGGPTQMVLWVDSRGNEPLGGDFTISFDAPAVNTTADVFRFTSTAPTEDRELAKDDVADLVNVFPNPYYGVNSFEENRFNRKITFSHLPERAIIRIFNLAGILVRRLEKDGPGQFIDWNLQNENSLPVASGIYIANVEMPDLGVTKNLKIALVKEQEFLRRF